MGIEVLFLVSASLLAPAVFLGFAAYWWAHHQERKGIERAWRGYARRRGYELLPASGEWPNRTSPVVHWERAGTGYRIETRGRDASLRTCVTARPAVARLGEAVIDGACLVEHERPPGFAARLLMNDVRRALAGFDLGSDVSLMVARGEVCLSWRATEENDARLDEAAGVVERVVAALDALS